MLQTIAHNRRTDEHTLTAELAERSLIETLTLVGAIARRRFLMLAFIIIVTLTFAFTYLITAPVLYTATAKVVVDRHQAQIYQKTASGDAPLDAGTIQTELEILSSDRVGLSVIRDLHLTDDPEFVSPRPTLFGAAINAIKHLFSKPKPQDTAQTLSTALAAFEGREKVGRVGLTYAIAISFTSNDPAKAARIANAIGNAYIIDQLEARYEATRRGSLWLQERIKELSTQANNADRAVVDFKKNNDINTVDSTGKLTTEQQLSDVNTQLTLARAATAEAKARYDRIAETVNQPISKESMPEALKSPVMVELRSKYLDLAGREAIWAKKYGVDHQATISLRNQMDELQSNMNNEISKIAEGYKNEYEIALARENSLKQSLKSSVSDTNVTNEAQVELRALTSTAESYRNMVDSLSKEHMESIQQETFPITEARLINPADQSVSVTSPKTTLVVVGSFMMGSMLGLGVITLQEMVDAVFRSRRQVETRLGLKCLALIQTIKPRRKIMHQAAKPDPLDRTIGIADPIWQYALDEPFSEYAEELRSIKVAFDLANASNSVRVIGVTSAVPDEGKSTTSVNLAQLMAQAGSRVLLVDADLRNPAMTRVLATRTAPGLVDLVSGGGDVLGFMWTDPRSGLTFLPVGGGDRRLAHTSELMGSDKLASVLSVLAESFDYVIVDLPPLAPVVDTRATTKFIDFYILVVRWGETKIEIVEEALVGAPEIHGRTLGVVLNNADPTLLARYERHRSTYYNKRYHDRYGITSHES